MDRGLRQGSPNFSTWRGAEEEEVEGIFLAIVDQGTFGLKAARAGTPCA
jgi:hypothetical protein